MNTTATLAVSTALLGMLVLARLRRPLPRHVASERAGVTSGRRLRRSRLTAMVVRPVIAIATVVALTSAVVAGPLFAIVLAGCAGVGHLARRRAARRRVQREIEASVPDAVELLVLTVHAGLSPAQAIDAARHHGPPAARAAFAEVHHRIHRGQRLGDALAALPEALGPGALAVAESIAAADRYGVPLATALDRIAHEARATRRRIAEASARTLPVRLTFPLVVCTLPSFVLLAIVPAVMGTLSSLRGTTP